MMLTDTAFQSILMIAVFALPLGVGLGLPVRRWQPALFRVAPWTALAAVAAVIWVPPGATVSVSWMLLNMQVAIDATGRLFLLFSSLLWLLSALYAQGYLASDSKRGRFFFFFMLSMAGNFGLIVSQDAVSFYVFFALMSFASYGLVVHNGDADALRAGRIYIYLVVIGEVMLFAAFVMQSQAAGSLLIPDFSNARPSAVAVGLILVGFGIKAGALPLHVWLPLAHPAAPTPASAVLSGAMIKAGLLGWLRFLPIGSAGLPQWGSLCIVAGLLAAYYAVAVGLPQQNPKTVLAYSSISQMGLMTVGVGLALGWPQTVPIVVPAVTIYAAHHCFAKGALFLGVGVASNAANLKPVVAGLILASLALAGAPLTSGAVAKVALKLPLKEMHEFWVAGLTLLLTLAAMGTTLLMARFLFVVTRPAEGHGRPQPIVWVSWAVSVLLTAVAVWLLPSARGAAGIALQPASLWQALWPVAAGLLAAGGLWFAAFRKHWHPAFHIPEGDLLAVVAALGRGCLRRGRRQSERVRQAVSRVLQIFQEARPAPERFQRLAARMEARLVSWQTAGLVFIGLLGCLLFLSLTG